MSRLWICKRTDGVGYDETDGLVIRAPVQEEALQIANTYPGKWEAKELFAVGETEVVFDSFNAG